MVFVSKIYLTLSLSLSYLIAPVQLQVTGLSQKQSISAG